MAKLAIMLKTIVRQRMVNLFISATPYGWFF
jgi:hypothetical protein